MTKEQIIKEITEKFIIIVMEEKPYERQDYIQNANQALSKTVDALLTKFEQEKKEQAKDIFERCVYISKEFNHKGVYKRLVDIAKEYGVEL